MTMFGCCTQLSFVLRGKNFTSAGWFVEEQWRENCCISDMTILELPYSAENSNYPYGWVYAWVKQTLWNAEQLIG